MTDTAIEETQTDAGSELALTPGQSTWTPQQLAVLRQIGLEAAEQADIDLFFHVCRTSGLDPFKREIYMIGRKTKITVREVNPDTGNERGVERYVDKFTIQTGINGFRKKAREIAELKGIKVGFEGPLWCGEDGVWRDIWPESKPPTAAKFIVFRDGEPISFVAHYDEYVQKSGNPATPNSMWSKMPRNQTAKCAEAGAIQRAFPDELGSLIFEDAAQTTVIDADGVEVHQPQQQRRRPSAGSGVAGMRAAREQRSQQHDPKTVAMFVDMAKKDPAVIDDLRAMKHEREQQAIAAEPAPDPALTPDESEIRKQVVAKLNDEIADVFGGLKLGGRSAEQKRDRLVVIRGLLGRPEIENTKQLDADALQTLRNELVQRRDSGSLDNDVREFINGEDLRQEGIEAEGGSK